jgi:hypothetical protein
MDRDDRFLGMEKAIAKSVRNAIDTLFVEWANDYRHYLVLHQELAQRLNYAA